MGLAGENLVTWVACPNCGRVRWKRIVDKDKLCLSCAARIRAEETNPITFTGGREPQAGDTTKASTIGLVGDCVMFSDPCAKCGKLRWVRKWLRGTHCPHCAPRYTGPRRDRHPGARYISGTYAFIYLEKDDPLRCMTRRDGWGPEHRILVARRIGRPLRRDEIVHHINGDRIDNRDSNLQLLTTKSHHSHLTVRDLQEQIRGLEKRIFFLEADNIVLRKQLESIANPEPSRREDPSGVCRDLTGDTLSIDTLHAEGEGKVHSSRKLGGQSA